MAWAFTQFKQQVGTGGNTTAYISSNTAGNFLVCGIEINSGTAISLADTQLNTWSAVTSLVNNGGSNWVQLWAAPNCKAGANSVVYTGGVGAYTNCNILEYSGIATSSPQDGSGVSGTGSSAAMAATLSGITAGDLAIAYGVGASDSVTTGSGWTQRFTSGSDGFSGLVDQVVVGTSAVAALNCASANWAVVLAAFKIAGAPPPSTPNLRTLLGVGI